MWAAGRRYERFVGGGGAPDVFIALHGSVCVCCLPLLDYDIQNACPS